MGLSRGTSILTLMNLTGAPAFSWLLCLVYVCSLLNVIASPALDGITPLQALSGQVPHISHFLHFSFWEPVYYKVDENESDHRFPSQSNEKRGHWVGFADNKDDDLTWKILSDQTQQITTRFAVRSANKTSPNLRLDPPKGEDQPQDLTSDMFVYGRPHPDGYEEPHLMSTINFDDLLGGLSCYLWMRMGRARELPYLIMSILLTKLKFTEKTSSDLN